MPCTNPVQHRNVPCEDGHFGQLYWKKLSYVCISLQRMCYFPCTCADGILENRTARQWAWHASDMHEYLINLMSHQSETWGTNGSVTSWSRLDKDLLKTGKNQHNCGVMCRKYLCLINSCFMWQSSHRTFLRKMETNWYHCDNLQFPGTQNTAATQRTTKPHPECCQPNSCPPHSVLSLYNWLMDWDSGEEVMFLWEFPHTLWEFSWDDHQTRIIFLLIWGRQQKTWRNLNKSVSPLCEATID